VNSNCYGDTVVCPDTSVYLENNVDSEKSSISVKWKNNNLGAAKTITSTGKIQGTDYAYGENATTTVGNYLFSYPLDSDKLTKDILNNILSEFGVSAKDAYADFLSREEKAVSSGSKTEDISKQEIASVKKAVEDATGESLDKVEAKSASTTSGSSGSSSSSSSSSGSSSSSSSSSKSSGSSSVSSGQETTIFFVFGGVMLAAAGLMFLARKKRQF
jgi:LPXTG-motif cell wall-anchored protein